MTKDKKEKEGKNKEETKEKENVNEEAKNNNETEVKEEQKLIEEKEGADQKLLEYYSKEELVDEVKKLENIVKGYEEKISELNNWRKKYIHLQAEFENAQKRWDKSRQDLRTQSAASVLKGFLPLYDSFKKALENAEENSPLRSFNNQFMNILKSFGAEPIPVKTNDKFDYNIHEALSSIEKEDVPENSIIDIVQDGWKINKEVLRYTKVIISKKPKPPEPKPKIDGASEQEINIEESKEEISNNNEKAG